MSKRYGKDIVAEAVEQNYLGEQGIQTGSAANSIGYANRQARQRGGSVGAPSSNVELGPFGKKLLGSGLLLLGLWVSPLAGPERESWYIPGILIGLGLLGLFTGIRETWGDGWQPFEDIEGARGHLLRLLWFFRPRLWMLVWLAAIVVFMIYGSPHLRITYGPDGCGYFGLNGWVETGGGNCPLVRAFRL